MYKIYYNGKWICLLHQSLKPFVDTKDQDILIVYYPKKTKFLLSLLDKIEKNVHLKAIFVLTDKVKKLKNDFFSLFTIVSAAGGLVVNSDRDILFIYRKGKWDLPKGKIEENESKKSAALREVSEETGLNELEIIQKIHTTYHIYSDKVLGKRVLKINYWYLMFAEQTSLIPQTEEDIEEVKWASYEEYLKNEYTPIYANIQGVINTYRDILDLV